MLYVNIKSAKIYSNHLLLLCLQVVTHLAISLDMQI